MTVLTFTRDRGSARPLAGAVELQQVHRASDARATRVASGARDVAVALADHLALARALTLAADVALGVRAADHVLLARAVATAHLTGPPRGTDDLLGAAAARLVAVEEARALEAAATATQTDVTAAVVVRGRLHDTAAAASRVARPAASRACSGIGVLRRDHASATAFTGVARFARRASRSSGRSCRAARAASRARAAAPGIRIRIAVRVHRRRAVVVSGRCRRVSRGRRRARVDVGEQQPIGVAGARGGEHRAERRGPEPSMRPLGAARRRPAECHVSSRMAGQGFQASRQPLILAPVERREQCQPDVTCRARQRALAGSCDQASTGVRVDTRPTVPRPSPPAPASSGVGSARGTRANLGNFTRRPRDLRVSTASFVPGRPHPRLSRPAMNCGSLALLSFRDRSPRASTTSSQSHLAPLPHGWRPHRRAPRTQRGTLDFNAVDPRFPAFAWTLQPASIPRGMDIPWSRSADVRSSLLGAQRVITTLPKCCPDFR